MIPKGKTPFEAFGWEGRLGFPRRWDGSGENFHGYRGRDLRSTLLPAFTVTCRQSTGLKLFAEDGTSRSMKVEEIGMLQTFPADYPWQGSHNSKCTQIGNAVPPRFARAILARIIEGEKMGNVVDLFAGPGGWDVGAQSLGLDPIGVEWDEQACATRRAAGLRTVQADVSKLNPHMYEADGIIASPPCQGFTLGGLKKGIGDASVIFEAIAALEVDPYVDLSSYAERCDDTRSMLVVEPLRWTLQLEPEWIAFEQVPFAIHFWNAIAEVLHKRGYRGESGILNANDFGVPQARKRAILVMSRTRSVSLPDPLEGEAVTMAQAIGWGITDGPARTLIARSSGQGEANPLDGGSSTRKVYADAMERGAWIDSPRGNPSQKPYRRMNVTLAEAGVLQTFPADYPWQGDWKKQVEQIGNAVPPRFAAAILAAVTGKS